MQPHMVEWMYLGEGHPFFCGAICSGKKRLRNAWQGGDGAVCLSGRGWCRMFVRKGMVPCACQEGDGAAYLSEWEKVDMCLPA